MRRRRGRGFTLVEVLVAVAVLSLIMLATVTGLRTLGNTQATIESRIERVDEIRAVSGFLRDTFGAAIPGSDVGGLSTGGGGLDGATFQVTADGSVLWRALVLFGEAYGGSYQLRLGQEEDRVVLRWREPGRQAPESGWNNAPSRTLVSGVDAFEVAYRRRAGDAWRGDWDGRGAPRWLRLRISSGGRYWPDLVMVVPQ